MNLMKIYRRSERKMLSSALHKQWSPIKQKSVTKHWLD